MASHRITGTLHLDILVYEQDHSKCSMACQCSMDDFGGYKCKYFGDLTVADTALQPSRHENCINAFGND